MRRNWTKEEDNILRSAINEVGDDWRKQIDQVAEIFNHLIDENGGSEGQHRTENQIKAHWYTLSKKAIETIEWNEEDDTKLIELYKKHKDAYGEIANEIGAYSAKDVQNRIKVLRERIVLNPEAYNSVFLSSGSSRQSTRQSSRQPSPPSTQSSRHIEDLQKRVDSIITTNKQLTKHIEDLREKVELIHTILEEIHEVVVPKKEKKSTK